MLHKLGSALVIITFSAAGAAQAEDTAVPLRTVVIEGSTAFDAAEHFDAYRDRIGLPLTREAAQAIVAAIADRYREAGFAGPESRPDLALAPQGILRLRVHEPRVTRVTIEGAPGRHRDRLERIGQEIVASRPLRRDAIPRAIAEMRAIPGLTVTPTTRRDPAAPNAFVLVLDADFSPVSGVVRVNNRGTEQIGPQFVLGQLVVNDLAGRDEKFGLLFSAAADTTEYRSGGIFYDAAVGASGARGMLLLFRSDSAPNESPLNLTDEYRRERAALSYSRPFNRGGDQSWVASLALEAEDLVIDRDGVDVRHDRLRVLQAGLRRSWRAGAATRLTAALDLRQGLDTLGAGLRADDLPEDRRELRFRVAELHAGSFTRLGAAWSLRTDWYAQYSADVLPDGERFKIGGERLGRGFEVAEIAGDRGLGAKFVLRRELAAGGKLGRASLYGLYDIGAAWKQDVGGRESAATAGAGFALDGARWSGYVEAVTPLTRADIEGKRSTALFAELAFRF